MLNLRVSLKDKNVKKAVKMAEKSNVKVKMFKLSVVFKADEDKAKKTILAIMKIVEGYQLF